MALSHLSLDSDKYEIFIDNRSNEDSLNENDISSAASWITRLNADIDLSPLLYLKSTTAALALSTLTVNNIPLTFSENEYIHVTINLPSTIATCNQYYNEDLVRNFNSIPYKIPLQHFHTSDSEEAVSFLNRIVAKKVTYFLLKSCLRLVLDNDIFLEDNTGELSLEDINLIIRYLDVILFSRRILHEYLTVQAGINDDDISSLITFQSRDHVSVETERQIIDKSNVLRDPSLRPKPVQNNNMSLDLFYGVDLQNAYTQQGGPKMVIQNETHQWLEQSMIIERTNDADPNSPLTQESMNDMLSCITSNKALITQALKAREILTMMRTRLDKNENDPPSLLFHENLITLGLDSSKSKLKCELHPELFLCPNTTSCFILMPSQTSYVLGCPHGTLLSIGPIINNITLQNENKPKMTNNITSSKQVPFHSIRPLPKIIYVVVSDIISTLRRDMWLKNTPYESCHIIHTHVVDEETIQSKFISKTSEHEIFYRISNLKTLLNNFQIHLLDQNFRPILFPQKTYSKISLTIKPAIHEN